MGVFNSIASGGSSLFPCNSMVSHRTYFGLGLTKLGWKESFVHGLTRHTGNTSGGDQLLLRSLWRRHADEPSQESLSFQGFVYLNCWPWKCYLILFTHDFH